MSTHALPRPTAALHSRALAPGPAALTAIVIVLAAWYLNAVVSWRQAALFLVGSGAGVVLYHAAFGFTSAWRVFISDRRGAGLRAQMMMLAITCAVFFPLLAAGTFLGQPLRGSVSPVGVGVAAGAFIFGLGMQLGGGCASGTLFSSIVSGAPVSRSALTIRVCPTRAHSARIWETVAFFADSVT